MDRDAILGLAEKLVETSEQNRLSAEVALLPELAGMRYYEKPLLGVAAAADPYFETLREPRVVGPHFRLPEAWLPGAETVLSFFFPYTDEVVVTNGGDPLEPSPQWLHARIEGQAFIFAVCGAVEEAIRRAGYAAATPSSHPDFRSRSGGGSPDGTLPFYTSNWSERHVAHVAGLGTFGLSAGLITERGIAGRFGSVVTTLKLQADPRRYEGAFEYCTRCGACIPRCAPGAISDAGKAHPICDAALAKTLQRHNPRYGCGKCQVRVPCSRGIPTRRRA